MKRNRGKSCIIFLRKINIYVLFDFFYWSVTFLSKGRVPMRSTSSVEQPIELTLRVDLLIHTSSFTSTCGYFGADATSSPPFTLATALHRLHPTQGRAFTTPTSWRARHCNVFVKRTRPNAVDQLGWTTYRANSPGWLINPYVQFHFYLWLRRSWRYRRLTNL